MPEKLKGVCRLCLSKEGFMFPIFRKDIKSETPFRIKILSCASIEIFADDDLPTEICHVCAHQVEKSFQFRTVCENSDAALRSQLSESRNEIMEKSISITASELESQELLTIWSDKKHCANSEENDDNSGFLANSICKVEENDLKVFICFACSSGFVTYDKLIDHLIKCHPDINLYPCKTCKLHFSNLNEYKTHLSMKHALTCHKCDHVFQYQKNLELHLKTHSLDNFTCKFCKKLFDKNFELKKHELTHINKMCRFCCKVFTTKEDYLIHMTNCNETYPCKFCNESFELKKDLIEHVNKYHENSLTYKCKDCNKIFGKETDFQKHICDEIIEESLSCKYCQQTFSNLSLLETHVSVEHNESLLVCKFCTKSFTLKSALRRHEKSHSGLKPYQCKYCPRKFKDNSTCIVHIRTHTGEHPFQCQECHKDFKQLANLKMHTYRHHKITNKAVEEKAEIMREAEEIYDQLYSTSIIDDYSPEDAKSFQQIDSDISSNFSENATTLNVEH